MCQLLVSIPGIRIVDQKPYRERHLKMAQPTFWTQATELIVSLLFDKSHSFDTAAVLAAHKYTADPRPTPSTLVLDQSTRFR